MVYEGTERGREGEGEKEGGREKESYVETRGGPTGNARANSSRQKLV